MSTHHAEPSTTPIYDDDVDDTKGKAYDGPTTTVNTVEDGSPADDVEVDVHTHLRDGVVRNMEQRHIQMIALAGTLGTGLFLGSGKTIAHGGPAGSLIAYLITGSMAYAMLVCAGEMAVFAPISGGYIHYAERWLHPSAGFALGWQVIFQYCISIPSEIISAGILISFWDKSFTIGHQAAYIIAMSAFCIAIQFMGVRWFGESEFIFATIKIALVVGLIIAGLVVDLGGGPDGDRIGFRYWRDPGAFAPYHSPNSLGKFLGTFTNFVQAAGSYMGTELITIAAAEVKNPRVSVAKAVQRLFWRIIIFYIGSILIVGMLVPYNDPTLLQSTGTAASSPFVRAFNRAGIKALPSIINAAVLTSAISSGNSLTYSVTRMVYGMALRGHAPKVFARTTSKGLPIVSVTAVSFSYALAFLSLSKGSSTVLNWLSNISALSGYICWCIIGLTYLRFKKGVEAQGMDRKKFHYYNRFQPWPAYWVIFWCLIVIIFNGWEVFTKGNWSGTNFVINYINIPFFILLIGGYTLIRRPKFVKLEQLDFVSNIPTDEEVSYEEPEPKHWWGKMFNYIFT
ncbi:hypothetical protein IAR55_002577 [Kwoniella newhampshirensis]|uniref:Amino acid permease/ SLC12A domain-containing protein n=1 Tax=Kwoniella newhampshirensis TaxID=1651941 RepID=A0AAW0Z1V1_9TREE